MTPGHSRAEVPIRRIVLHEIRVVGSAAHVWNVDLAGAVSLLASGAVDPTPLVSACFALDDAVPSGFERLERDRSALKILIAP